VTLAAAMQPAHADLAVQVMADIPSNVLARCLMACAATQVQEQQLLQQHQEQLRRDKEQQAADVRLERAALQELLFAACMHMKQVQAAQRFGG
jgi:hypothetical protein